MPGFRFKAWRIPLRVVDLSRTLLDSCEKSFPYWSRACSRLSWRPERSTHGLFRPASSALTKNPIYTSGKLPVRSCPEYSKEIPDYLTAENYLREGAECLDATWTSFFKKAKLPFRTPSMEFISKSTTKTRACGSLEGFWGGAYCQDTQGIVVLVDGWMLEYEGTPFLFYVLAHEYGHHVQQRAGIVKAHDKLTPQGHREGLPVARPPRTAGRLPVGGVPAQHLGLHGTRLLRLEGVADLHQGGHGGPRARHR